MEEQAEAHRIIEQESEHTPDLGADEARELLRQSEITDDVIDAVIEDIYG